MIFVEGAPFDQGRKQGAELRDEITGAVRTLRERFDALGWLGARVRTRRGAGRALESFLPQQHERLQGIARASGTSVAALELFELLQRVAGTATLRGTELRACFDLPPALESLLVLRQSAPDAGGMPSVELTAAPWAGALAGVNAEGIAFACLEDRGWREPTLRLLGQDLLFRARDLRAGIEHLQRRAAYAGGSGVLLLLDAKGEACRVELRSGQLAIREVLARESPGPPPMLCIDAGSRGLLWRDRNGVEQRAQAGPPSAAR